jgi:hypothetical protein
MREAALREKITFDLGHKTRRHKMFHKVRQITHKVYREERSNAIASPGLDHFIMPSSFRENQAQRRVGVRRVKSKGRLRVDGCLGGWEDEELGRGRGSNGRF